MELESLQLKKFKKDQIKKDQLFSFNGGGMPTGGGCNLEGTHNGQTACYDYSYDAVRTAPDGSTFLTFHGRSNVRYGPCY